MAFGEDAAAVVDGVPWYALGAECSGPTVLVTPSGGVVGWAGALP